MSTKPPPQGTKGLYMERGSTPVPRPNSVVDVERAEGNRVQLATRPGKRPMLSSWMMEEPIVISPSDYKLRRITPTSFKIIEKIASYTKQVEIERRRKKQAESSTEQNEEKETKDKKMKEPITNLIRGNQETKTFKLPKLTFTKPDSESPRVSKRGEPTRNRTRSEGEQSRSGKKDDLPKMIKSDISLRSSIRESDLIRKNSPREKRKNEKDYKVAMRSRSLEPVRSNPDDPLIIIYRDGQFLTRTRLNSSSMRSMKKDDQLIRPSRDSHSKSSTKEDSIRRSRRDDSMRSSKRDDSVKRNDSSRSSTREKSPRNSRRDDTIRSKEQNTSPKRNENDDQMKCQEGGDHVMSATREDKDKISKQEDKVRNKREDLVLNSEQKGNTSSDDAQSMSITQEAERGRKHTPGNRLRTSSEPIPLSSSRREDELLKSMELEYVTNMSDISEHDREPISTAETMHKVMSGHQASSKPHTAHYANTLPANSQEWKAKPQSQSSKNSMEPDKSIHAQMSVNQMENYAMGKQGKTRVSSVNRYSPGPTRRQHTSSKQQHSTQTKKTSNTDKIDSYDLDRANTPCRYDEQPMPKYTSESRSSRRKELTDRQQRPSPSTASPPKNYEAFVIPVEVTSSPCSEDQITYIAKKQGTAKQAENHCKYPPVKTTATFEKSKVNTQRGHDSKCAPLTNAHQLSTKPLSTNFISMGSTVLKPTASSQARSKSSHRAKEQLSNKPSSSPVPNKPLEPEAVSSKYENNAVSVYQNESDTAKQGYALSMNEAERQKTSPTLSRKPLAANLQADRNPEISTPNHETRLQTGSRKVSPNLPRKFQSSTHPNEMDVSPSPPPMFHQREIYRFSPSPTRKPQNLSRHLENIRGLSPSRSKRSQYMDLQEINRTSSNPMPLPYKTDLQPNVNRDTSPSPTRRTQRPSHYNQVETNRGLDRKQQNPLKKSQSVDDHLLSCQQLPQKLSGQNLAIEDTHYNMTEDNRGGSPMPTRSSHMENTKTVTPSQSRQTESINHLESSRDASPKLSRKFQNIADHTGQTSPKLPRKNQSTDYQPGDSRRVSPNPSWKTQSSSHQVANSRVSPSAPKKQVIDNEIEHDTDIPSSIPRKSRNIEQSKRMSPGLINKTYSRTNYREENDTVSPSTLSNQKHTETSERVSQNLRKHHSLDYPLDDHRTSPSLTKKHLNSDGQVQSSNRVSPRLSQRTQSMNQQMESVGMATITEHSQGETDSREMQAMETKIPRARSQPRLQREVSPSRRQRVEVCHKDGDARLTDITDDLPECFRDDFPRSMYDTGNRGLAGNETKKFSPAPNRKPMPKTHQQNRSFQVPEQSRMSPHMTQFSSNPARSSSLPRKLSQTPPPVKKRGTSETRKPKVANLKESEAVSDQYGRPTMIPVKKDDSIPPQIENNRSMSRSDTYDMAEIERERTGRKRTRQPTSSGNRNRSTTGSHQRIQPSGDVLGSRATGITRSASGTRPPAHETGSSKEVALIATGPKPSSIPVSSSRNQTIIGIGSGTEPSITIARETQSSVPVPQKSPSPRRRIPPPGNYNMIRIQPEKETARSGKHITFQTNFIDTHLHLESVK